MRPRVLLVGRTRYRVPLTPSLGRKFDALEEQLDVRVLATGSASSDRDDRFHLTRPFPISRLDGLAFWTSLPLRVARELHSFRPDAILAQSAYDAAAAAVARKLARSEAAVIVDVHGDWRTATRLYGSPARRLLAPVGDRVALAGLTHADAVRSVSAYTTRLIREAGLEPADVFPAFMDLDPFLATEPAPFPERPQALFVGVLELYKNIDGLADAWRAAAPRLDGARLRIVGSGSQRRTVEQLVAELPAQTSWTPRLDPHQVVAALDDSTALVLPSRSEGMGRVVVEAFCRGRPVVATAVGGIPDLVRDGVNGVLVPPRDVSALAGAIVRVLGEPTLASTLGARARKGAASFIDTPEHYAARLRGLVEKTAPRLRGK
jgi:glycogen synthase